MKIEMDYCAKWLAVPLLDIVDILNVMLWAIGQSQSIKPWVKLTFWELAVLFTEKLTLIICYLLRLLVIHKV